MAVECKKPFPDIAYGFPVIVMRRGGPPKKNYLRISEGYFTLTLYEGSTTSKPSESLNGGPCTDNHYCESGSKDEYPCEPGTYQTSKKQSKCNSCRAGKYCPGSGLVTDS